MNPLSAIGGFLASFFLAGSEAGKEREQEGAGGRAYEAWLDEYGYEAQYQAWLKAHGTADGFVFKDPGEYPGAKS